MKKTLICYIISILFSIQYSWAQSQIVTEMANGVTELAGSFMENPYHHANTMRVNNLTRQAMSVVEELFMQVPVEAEADYYRILNMRKLLKGLGHITAGVSGRLPASVEATDFEALTPVFDAFGWKRNLIHSTTDVEFYEYRKDNFKMVLAKNMRPKKSEGDYNAVSYECYTWDTRSKKQYSFMSRVVFGGNYQFVECGDDETQYKKISKVSSKRGNGL